MVQAVIFNESTMMPESKLEVYLGIPMPEIERFDDSDEKFRSMLYSLLDDLVGASGKLAFHIGDGTIYPQIELLAKDAILDVAELGLCTKERLEQIEVLKISGTAKEEFYLTSDFPAEFKTSDVMHLVSRNEFCKQVSDLILLANIASVGVLEINSSLLVQNNSPSEFDAVPKMDGIALQFAVELADKTAWPPIATISIRDVWEWASRKLPDLDGFNNNPLGRALAAYSRLFEHLAYGEPMLLVWALVGLEALYCQSNIELGKQLREKSQLLLGKQESFKKIVTNMYEFRSKFVHGKQDFPGLYLLRNADPRFERYSDELHEAVSVAVALLAATLQELARRNWSGIQVSYTLQDSQ